VLRIINIALTGSHWLCKAW